MNLSSVLTGNRGEIVALVREGVCTIGEIAERVGLTPNAVRAHVASLERDGVLEASGKRPSAKRPAIEYQLTDAAEAFYARAYEPVLVALAQGLAGRLENEELEALFERIGSGLANESAGSTKLMRAESAAQALVSLGAVVRVEETPEGIWIRGRRCPLSSLVAECPQACRLGVGLVSSIVGSKVEERCRYEPFPACQFLIR
jgi:predicted ArsR family transcriptional regulator